jgi:phage gp46-like protein
MKAIILSLMTTLAVVSTFAASAQSAPVGSQQWWEEMDREGRAGRPS